MMQPESFFFSRFIFFFIVSLSLLAIGCSSSNNTIRTLPSSNGGVGEVILVSDLESKQKKSLTENLQQAYEGLPRYEARYKVIDLSVHKWKNNLRLHRTIVLLYPWNYKGLVKDYATYAKQQKTIDTLLYTKNERIFAVQNVWASDQQVILVAFKKEVPLNSTAYPKINKTLQLHDQQALLNAAFVSGQATHIEKKIVDQFKLDIKIPKGYVVAKDTSGFSWLRQDLEEKSHHIIIKQLDDLEILQDVIRIRDTWGKQYVQTNAADAYMATETRAPITASNLLGATYYKGIWKMENDFMGGPFVSTIVQGTRPNTWYYIEGFTYGPGKPLKNSIGTLQALIARIRAVD